MTGQEENGQILTHVKYQEKECEGIKSSPECHKQEIIHLEEGTRALAAKFEKLSEIIKEVISDNKKIKQTVREQKETTEGGSRGKAVGRMTQEKQIY
jgi:hypothetical protein